MSDERRCPYCGATDVLLIAHADLADWEIDPDDYDDDAEVWVCQNHRRGHGTRLCGWHEEAEPEEALEEHLREMEWLAERIEQAQARKADGA